MFMHKGERIEFVCRERRRRMNGKRWAVCVCLWIAGGLVLGMAGQYCRYAFQNRSLSAENGELSDLPADTNRMIDEKTKEIESDTREQSNELREEAEMEPGTPAAVIENLQLYNDQSEGAIRIGLQEPQNCDELESRLLGLPACSVHVEILEWNLDVEQVVKTLRRHWEDGGGQDGFYVSMTFHSDMFQEEQKPADVEKYIQTMQEALCTLAGAEYAEMIQDAMAQEAGYLWFVQLERVGELTCCTFEIGEPAYSPDTYVCFDEAADDFVYTNIGYYIAVMGKWEGKEVQGQCFRIPYTFNELHSIGIGMGYGIEGADVNFDGGQDLLIHEGSSGGSGGSWSNYRALVWEAGQFTYFPSFPENVHLLQFDRQRVVNRGDIGTTQYVLIYEVVNGEYVCTRKLLCEFHTDGTYELSYYEMDELVETHIFSDWKEAERLRRELYPDMSYWQQG